MDCVVNTEELLMIFVDVLLWRFNGLAYASVSDAPNGSNT
jgi:hypothetical protein